MPHIRNLVVLTALTALIIGCADADRDGHKDIEAGGEDCDDTRDDVYPGADELCDGVDNDCDGRVDEEPVDGDVYYVDFDDDGFGNENTALASCTPVTDHILVAGDCDDQRDDIHPDAPEVCDGFGWDEDCDGLINDQDDSVDASSLVTYYIDNDGDGFGDLADPGQALCEDPSDDLTWYVTIATDCDDERADVNPEAPEVCDELDTDENCNGSADDLDPEINTTSQTVFYWDFDKDEYGDEEHTGVRYCEDPSTATFFYASNNDDCDDGRSWVNPSKTERCDSWDTDEDCNGLSDDNDPDVDPSTQTMYYPDEDNDGYGDDTSAGEGWCDEPTTFGSTMVADNTDCHDDWSHIHPSASEICSDAYFDEDCDGVTCCADSDCASETFCQETDCTDGSDDDDDGAVDCEDGDCALDPTCYESDCADGDDEDDDGWVDCDDDDCWGETGCPKVRISVTTGNLTERWDRTVSHRSGWRMPSASKSRIIYSSQAGVVRSSVLSGSASGVVSVIPSSLTWSTATSPTQCDWQVGGLSAYFGESFMHRRSWDYSSGGSVNIITTSVEHTVDTGVTRDSVYLASGCDLDSSLVLPAALSLRDRGLWSRTDLECLWYQPGSTSSVLWSSSSTDPFNTRGLYSATSGTSTFLQGSAEWTVQANSCDW